MQVQLANNHRARLLQLANQFSVFGWNAVAILIASSRGADSRCIEQIFQADRNAVQRPSPAARHDFGLGLARLLQRRLRRNRDESIQSRIQLPDARETCARELQRGELARANLFRGFGYREHGIYLLELLQLVRFAL